ncbi:MAG: DUF1365 domain-containing protein [Planctomycetales bacterium]|nr:DUF1365 domain-containing protein [Planctomycetales bacterium]
MMHSCLYTGHVTHARFRPIQRRFRYAIQWAYLDLDEVDELVKRLRILSRRRVALASFCRSDHLGSAATPLKDAVREFVHQQTALRLTGPVRLLTQLRQFGLYFSPLNLYFCYDAAATSIVAVVAEVSNTPWNERHQYVLWEGNRRPNHTFSYQHAKTFHVSPFLGMDYEYRWRLDDPSRTTHMQISCLCDEVRVFDVQMQLQRKPLTDGHLLRAIARQPLAAVHTLNAIYWQALQLWIRRCRYFPHPGKTSRVAPHATTAP